MKYFANVDEVFEALQPVIRQESQWEIKATYEDPLMAWRAEEWLREAVKYAQGHGWRNTEEAHQ